MQTLVLRSSLERLWIGGRQAPSGPGPNDNWGWVTGEPWVYTDWLPLEPNDWSGDEIARHSGQLFQLPVVRQPLLLGQNGFVLEVDER